jgi:hypothetical protein
VQDTTGSEMAEPASIGYGVNFASKRRTENDAPYFSLNNPTNYVDGKLVANWQSITLPKQVSLGCVEGTVIARFRWHGCRAMKKHSNGNVNYLYDVPLYLNNYYANGARGWKVGLRCYDSGTSTLMYPTFHMGNGTSYYEFSSYNAGSSFLVKKGYWCDFAVSFKFDLTSGKVSVLYVHRLTRNDNNNYRTHAIYATSGTIFDLDATKFPASGVYPSYIGYSGMTSFDDPSSRGENTFGGDIHDIRIYNRSMGEGEIVSEFVDEEPNIVIGSTNESGDEFSDEAPAEVFNPKTMPLGKMRKTLNALHPSVTIRSDFDEESLDMPRLVEVRLLKKSTFSGDSIQLNMNGSRIGSLNVPSSGIVRFCVPAKRMMKFDKHEATGKYPAEFTFVRKGEFEGDVQFDSLSVCSGWQLGFADNKNEEFASNNGKLDNGGESYFNYYYNIGQNNISQFYPAILSGSSSYYRFFNLYFPVGGFGAGICDYKLTLKALANHQEANLQFFINDLNIAYQDMAANTLYEAKSYIIRAEALSSGGNVLKVLHADENKKSWVYLDYIRLEPIIPEGWRNSDEGITVKVR